MGPLQVPGDLHKNVDGTATMITPVFRAHILASKPILCQ